MRNPIIMPHPHEIRRPDSKPKEAIKTDLAQAADPPASPNLLSIMKGFL